MCPQLAWDSLSLSQPVPLARRLPTAYARTKADPQAVREALSSLVTGVDWNRLPWLELMDWLLGIGRADIPLSRLAEGHIDALRIAGQAERTLQRGQLYGVWASRSGATGIRAVAVDGGWQLHGTIRFASGAGLLDRALVPVWTGDDQHLLIDLAVGDLPTDDSDWRTSAMRQSRSHTVTLEGVVVADAVIGEENFYLQRPGFFPGGVGVAAVWTGGAARVIDLLLAWLGERQSSTVTLRLGRIRTHITAATAVVRQTGVRLDDLLTPMGEPRFTIPDGYLRQIATEARAAVAQAVRATLDEARTIAGPAGVAFDGDLSGALDDLGLYTLQQNRDNDAVYLGEMLYPANPA